MLFSGWGIFSLSRAAGENVEKLGDFRMWSGKLGSPGTVFENVLRIL